MKGLYEIINLMSKLSGGILTEAILMEATRDEIYTQYYDEHNGKVKRIPRKIFDTLCLIGDVDDNPQKMSEFAKWLCDGYKEIGNTKAIYDVHLDFIFRNADDLKRNFVTFRKIQKIKPEGIDLNLRNYTIDSFCEEMEYVRENGLDYSQKDIKKLGSDTVYQDDTWKVMHIKSRDASLYYGRGTTWCTSSLDTKMYFEDYINRGLLFIFINIKNNMKYQGFYSFDFIWDEFKNPENRTVYPEDIFPKEMFDDITRKAKTILEKRFANVWQEEAVFDDDTVINDTFKVLKVSRFDRYRVKNMKTGEFLTLPQGNTFTNVNFSEMNNLLFLEENYGVSYGVLLINGDKAEIIEPKITGYAMTFSKVYDENHNYIEDEEAEFLIFKYSHAKSKIFNAQKLTFVQINNKEDFKNVFSVGDVLCIEMFNEKHVIFSLKTKQPVLVDGDIYLDRVSYKGFGIFLVTTARNTYLYNDSFDTFIDIPDEDSLDFKMGFACIDVGDRENSRYKLYNKYKNTFLNVDGVDSFDELQQISTHVLILRRYSEIQETWLYNTYTNSFCDSTDIPYFETDIEGFSNNIFMFWNNDDILTGYCVTENKVFPLPITIDYESVKECSKRNMDMGDKYVTMMVFFINNDRDKIIGISLKNDGGTIIYKPNENEDPKVYQF